MLDPNYAKRVSMRITIQLLIFDIFAIDEDLKEDIVNKSLLLNKQQRRDTTLMTCFHWVHVLILNHDLAHNTEEQLMGFNTD